MGIFSKKIKPVAFKSFRTYEVMPNVTWTPKWSDFNSIQAIRQGYKRSTWVYSCVRLRAANIAAVPWTVEVRRGDEWMEDDRHPLKMLLDYPNPSYDFSMMVRQWLYHLDLGGDAFSTKVRNGAGKTVEVWPLFPDYMEILPGRDRMIAAYRYRKQMVSRDIPSDDIIHLKYANPGDMYYGLSPLHAAARAVDIDEEAEKWQKISLQNMAVPPGGFMMEGEVTQEQYEMTRKIIKEQSGPEHAREPWVMANGKWQNMAQTSVEMDFINSRKMTREEICSAYSVPPPLVGIYENATLANIETARQILWREGLIPALDEIQGQLNLQLASEYGTDVRIVYDLSNVEALAENYKEKVDNARTLWSMGVPLTEINQRLELGLNTDDIVGADKGYLPPGLLPTDIDFDMDMDTEPGNSGTAAVAFGEEEEETEEEEEEEPDEAIPER